MNAKSSSSRLVGYARVSSNGQELKLQLAALTQAGCTKANIFTDKVCGAKADRPGLDKCLQQLKQGDVLVVWRLDRLGRSMRHLIDLVEQLRQRGVGFKSLCNGVIDTTTASGELIFHIFTALAQFERRLIQERTNAGVRAKYRYKLGLEIRRVWQISARAIALSACIFLAICTRGSSGEIGFRPPFRPRARAAASRVGCYSACPFVLANASTGPGLGAKKVQRIERLDLEADTLWSPSPVRNGDRALN